MMMKGGNAMNPIFPRLRVDDSEKGGPKAPPRNKMALYEQLSIPSQRFNSMLPLPPNNANILLPSMSSSLGGCKERSNSIVSTRDEILGDTSSDLSTKFKNSGSLKRQYASLNQVAKSISMDMLNRNDVPNARLHLQENTLTESGRCLENASKVGMELCSRQSVGVHNGSPYALDNRSLEYEEKTQGAMPVEGVNRHNNVPDASMEENISAFDICPEDVVGILGEKHFWTVRKAISNQQRVFSVQVFELHRLIKVQRLIAGYTFYIDKPSLDASNIKKLPSEDALQPPLIVKVKDISRKPDINFKYVDENAFAELPSTSGNDDTSKGLVIHRPTYESYSGNTSSTPVVANSGTFPRCVSPPKNQWLVPVMSPLEGLVYKPCTCPGPPTAGLFTAVCGSCCIVNLAIGGRDFPNIGSNIAASHQHGIGILQTGPTIGQTNVPRYGMQHMSRVTAVQSKANFTVTQQSSCNMSSQLDQSILYCAKKNPASNETEKQGSTIDSPSERDKVDALPLFPTEPTMPACNDDARSCEQRTQVIKVIPHNRISATESAARIFRSIQEERKLYD